MPRFRFTIRRMMIAVAVAALVIVAVRVAFLRRAYLVVAERYAAEGATFRVDQKRAERELLRVGPGAAMRTWSQRAERMQERAEAAEWLRRKYERAARYPWLPVEPDPPEPE